VVDVVVEERFKMTGALAGAKVWCFDALSVCMNFMRAYPLRSAMLFDRHITAIIPSSRFGRSVVKVVISP
jgi:hypothetical protein